MPVHYNTRVKVIKIKFGSGEKRNGCRGQGAGGRGEKEWLLSNRKFKIISYSPLLPAPVRPCFFWGVGSGGAGYVNRNQMGSIVKLLQML